jgi:dUTP pyrophosphatase
MSKPKKIRVKFLDVRALVPSRATDGSAGYDLACIDRVLLGPGERRMISTGLALAMPAGYEGQVRSRSSLALAGVTVANSPGTIDSDYRGEIKVILQNLSSWPWHCGPGTRVAQLVVHKVPYTIFSVVDELDETTRGEGGFGSTGE